MGKSQTIRKKKKAARLPQLKAASAGGISSFAHRLAVKAQRIASAIHGSAPTPEQVSVVADRLLDEMASRGGDEVDEAASDSAESAETPAAADADEGRAPVDLAAFCNSCHTTDPAAFSQRMLHKRGRHGDRVRRCRACVAAAEATETLQAASRRDADRGGEDMGGAPAVVQCASCRQQLPASAFSRSQLSKAEGCQRCAECVRESQASLRPAPTVAHEPTEPRPTNGGYAARRQRAEATTT